MVTTTFTGVEMKTRKDFYKKDKKEYEGTVLMQHGIFSSADDWVRVGSMAPAFEWLNKGWDVWLGNNRGSKYSLGMVDDQKMYVAGSENTSK